MTDPAPPRIQPVLRADADADQAELFATFGEGEPLHLFGTLAHHAKLANAWLPFGGRLLLGGLLDDRDRELAILRTSARCGSDYEWGQHVGLGRAAGLSDDEITACAEETPGAPFDEADRTLLRGVDELVADHELTDTTWHALAERFDEARLVEFTLLVGHYAMLAGFLNSARVAPDGPLPVIGTVE